jgi:hypothetical protein
MPSRADDNIENAVAALESGDINKYSPSLSLIILAHWYLQKQTSRRSDDERTLDVLVCKSVLGAF